jgi:hypothetical protein
MSLGILASARERVPPFVPSSIAGLTVWWAADKLTGYNNGDQITSWPAGPDTSVVGNVVTTGTSTNEKPKYMTNVINGKPVVQFKVNEGYVRANPTLHKDFTLVYVARIIGPSPGRIICTAYPEAGNMLYGFWTTYMDVAYVTGGGGFFTPDTRIAWTNAWKLYSADAESTPLYKPRFFSNGVLLGTAPVDNPTDGWNNRVNLSGYALAGTNETCDCQVAEVLIYNRKLSDADRQADENYLRTKYAIT